jgi:ERCC4-type nuclease
MIIIDNREHKLIELIKNTSSFTIPYEIKKLDIGDIIISSSKHPDKSLIIERKCMTDMISSIKDGRYKEQKIRLQAERSNSNTICYLLEGLVNDLRKPNDKTLLYGSIISSIFRDTIPIIRTTSLQETLDILIRLYERMNKNINDFFTLKNNNLQQDIKINDTPERIIINTSNSIVNTSNSIVNTSNSNSFILDTPIILNDNLNNKNNNNETNKTINNENTENNNLYLHSIKKCKKDNMTPKLWNQLILTNIPGVSTSIAIKINEIYPTITSLLNAYTNCETDNDRIKLLSTILLTHTEKQKRHIGKVISKRIYEYLYLDN